MLFEILDSVDAKIPSCSMTCPCCVFHIAGLLQPATLGAAGTAKPWQQLRSAMLCGYLPVFGKRLGGVARNILEFFIRLGKVYEWQSMAIPKFFKMSLIPKSSGKLDRSLLRGKAVKPVRSIQNLKGPPCLWVLNSDTAATTHYIHLYPTISSKDSLHIQKLEAVLSPKSLRSSWPGSYLSQAAEFQQYLVPSSPRAWRGTPKHSREGG